jgi:hypothetical protein
MEVHSHPHHQGKKNWKSYIWEFLMLFFAVFCGFLAEWKLEQVIENHREEEYIHSIVEDINADIVQTDGLVLNLNTLINKSDTLLSVLSSEEIKTNSNQAKELWRTSIGFPDFVQNDRTIQQLKSSGALRIIRKKAVSDKIMDVTQNNMNTYATNNSLYSQSFDFIKLNNPAAPAVPLTENGKKLLNESFANRALWKTYLIGLRKRFTSLNNKGKNVVEVIKKQYKLK